jgi:hypothetical protein
MSEQIGVTEIKSAWRTSDGRLFQCEKKAQWHQQYVLNLNKYKEFLRPYFSHGEKINFIEAVDILKRWEDTRPRKEWVGLTEDDLESIYKANHNEYGDDVTGKYERSIEAKLKELNT